MSRRLFHLDRFLVAVNESTPVPTRPEWQAGAALLLQGPVFEYESERWRCVSQGRSDLDGYFRQIGLRLIIDPLEGYAFLEQVPDSELNELPRIIKRRQLTMGATIYGFFLRQELDRALKEEPGIQRVRRTLRQIRTLVAEFFPATNNETADRGIATKHLFDLGDLGFVRRIPDSGEGNETNYELTRLLRAKFNPDLVEDFLSRIRAHLKRKHNRNGDEPKN